MADAAKTLASLRRILEHRNHWLDDDEAKAVQDAIAIIERLTPKPMTLEECRDILNANEYSFCFAWEIQGPWRVEEPYVVASSNDDVDFGDECTIRLNLFEARCLAQGFISKKEAARA